MPFQDHFSSRSAGYAVFRPTYPPELFAWLASIAPGRRLAWDCATGNGQAARGLAPHFDSVIATDASADQVRRAEPIANVSYRVATAEQSGLDPGEVELITVAQALHWFDRLGFWAEARRIAVPEAVLAVWMYNLPTVDPAIDRLVHRFYRETVGPYWPGDRVLVDQEYRTIALPFPEIAPPPFSMAAEWTLAHFVGFLRTWSAVARYFEARGHDPVDAFEREVAPLWGGDASLRLVRWPLHLRVARL
jgi:hypothetical protein